MKVLIVLAHPEPKSFNGAMLQTTIEVLQAEGHEVKISDLYQMNFNPISNRSNFVTTKDSSFFKPQIEEIYATEADGFAEDIKAEQEKIAWCDLMIWQFPLWWFSVPAILKGWVDRVFAMGKFYGYGKIYDSGVFKGKKAMLSVSTGGNMESYLNDGFNGDIENILKPIHRGMLEFVGFSVLKPQLEYSVAHLTDQDRKSELEKWALRLKHIFDEERIDVGRY